MIPRTGVGTPGQQVGALFPSVEKVRLPLSTFHYRALRTGLGFQVQQFIARIVPQPFLFAFEVALLVTPENLEKVCILFFGKFLVAQVSFLLSPL